MKRNKGFVYPKENEFTYCNDIKNTGYDYSDTLMKNNLSSLMFKNSYLNTFLNKFIGPYFVGLINAVKIVRLHYNIAVDKNYKNIN